MRFKYIALSVLLVVASISFTRTTLDIIKSSKRLDETKDEISALTKQKNDLEKSIEYKKSDSYVEKTARDELNMIKPGESVYVVRGLSDDTKKLEQADNNVLSAATTRSKDTKSLSERAHNLRIWWQVFF